MSLVSLAEYDRAKQDKSVLMQKQSAADKQRDALFRQRVGTSGEERNKITAEINALSRRQFEIADQIQLNQDLIDVFEKQPTVPSASDTARADKYQKSAGYNAETAQLPNLPDYAQLKTDTNFQPFPELVSGKRVVPGVAPGAQRSSPEPTNFIFKDVTGKKLGQDLRVKIRVPSNYLTPINQGLSNELSTIGGIIFPYTPQISLEMSADYASMAPLHSNFSIYFYQRSKVGEIAINGKFTVENSKEAAIYIATTHLLRSLTRMRSGGLTGDPDSGSPPPICRLDAYGEMMLKNVPVAIKSVRIELPEGVDYFTFKGANGYGPTSVPTVSTIAVTCIPIYSRNEMQNFSVSKYIGSSAAKSQGFI
jgi:hypothetical protein